MRCFRRGILLARTRPNTANTALLCYKGWNMDPLLYTRIKTIAICDNKSLKSMIKRQKKDQVKLCHPHFTMHVLFYSSTIFRKVKLYKVNITWLLGSIECRNKEKVSPRQCITSQNNGHFKLLDQPPHFPDLAPRP